MNALDTPTSPAGSTRRNRLATALTGLFVLLGLVLTASPASAAGSAAPDVYGCFVYSNGAAYANKPIQLLTSQGAVVRSGNTNASGCATFVDVAGNSTYSIRAYWTYSVGSAIYAWSGRTANGSIGNLNTTYTFPGTWVNLPRLP